LGASEERETMNDSETLENALTELGALCRCEMMAVQSYDRALLSPVLARFSPLLRRCRRSHQERSYLLSWRVSMLGGSLPAPSTDADAVAETELSIGEKAALAALEAHEERAVREYRERIAKLDTDSRELVESQIFPAQLETHIMMRALKRELGVAQAHAQL
jgi:hypothetical protein